jgi:hypothetical protein
LAKFRRLIEASNVVPPPRKQVESLDDRQAAIDDHHVVGAVRP